MHKKELFIFWTSLTFYSLLYFNLNNKTLIIAFLALIIWLQFRYKNLVEVVFWSLVISLPLLVGKTYIFNLIPAQRLNYWENPDGYNQVFVLTISNLLVIFLLIRLFLDQLKLKVNIWKYNIIGIALLAWIVLSGLSAINSVDPDLSLLFFFQSLQIPIAFIYAIKIIKKKENRTIFLFILLSQLVFEGVWSIWQFINSGPLGRSIELKHGIVPFGGSADEDVWRYRPVGTFPHANILASYLTPLLIITFSMLYEKKKLIVDNIRLIVISLSLGLIAVIISISRSAWVALFFGVLVLVYYLEKKMGLMMKKVYQRRLMILIAIGVVLMPWFILPRLIKSYGSFFDSGGGVTREKQISESWLLVEQRPFFGTGFKMSVVEMFNNNPKGVTYTFP